MWMLIWLGVATVSFIVCALTLNPLFGVIGGLAAVASLISFAV